MEICEYCKTDANNDYSFKPDWTGQQIARSNETTTTREQFNRLKLYDKTANGYSSGRGNSCV